MTLILALILAASAPNDLDARRKQLADLLNEQWEYNLKDSPEFASILGDKRYNDRLSDFSEKHIALLESPALDPRQRLRRLAAY